MLQVTEFFGHARWITLCEELVHGDEDDGDANEEVEREGVAEQRSRHDAGEDGGDGGGVLFEDGVCILEEEGGQDALQRVVHHQQHRHLHTCTPSKGAENFTVATRMDAEELIFIGSHNLLATAPCKRHCGGTRGWPYRVVSKNLVR